MAEAVRQRCCHIAATKADQAYGVECAVFKVERSRLQCLPMTSQLVGQRQQVSSAALAAKASTLTVRCNVCRTAVHGQVKGYACELGND